MVLDGASSHNAKDLPIPENIRLLALPPNAPELNPQEHVCDELREKKFPNRVFNHLDAVIRQFGAWLAPSRRGPGTLAKSHSLALNS
jgi:hypothetical protein